jgi:hypothetical protein
MSLLDKGVASYNVKTNYVVYIATNEKDESILNELRKNGYVLFEDLGMQSRNKYNFNTLSQLDIFLIELQLLINADHFFGWGVTEVNKFVNRARAERRGRA